MNYIPKSMANFKLLHLLKLCLNDTRFRLRSRRLKQFLIYTLLNCSYKGSLRSQIFSHIHSRENIKYVQVSSYSFLYLFIWLHQALTAGTWDLQSSLWHVEFLVVACVIQFPDQGSNVGSLHLEHGALATGPLGKSHQ